MQVLVVERICVQSRASAGHEHGGNFGSLRLLRAAIQFLGYVPLLVL